MFSPFKKILSERVHTSPALMQVAQWEELQTAWRRATGSVFSSKRTLRSSLIPVRFSHETLEVACHNAAAQAAAKMYEQKLLASLNAHFSAPKVARIHWRLGQ